MTIPGIGKRIAEVVIAEIGVDLSRFPTAAHLASWAGMCPTRASPQCGSRVLLWTPVTAQGCEQGGPNPTRPGESRLIFSVYLPLGLDGATIDGTPVTLSAERALGRNVFETFFTLAPGGGRRPCSSASTAPSPAPGTTGSKVRA